MLNKYKDFEDYLKDMHSDEYTGLDDDMPDAFNDWLEMDVEDLIHYADLFADIRYREGQEFGMKIMTEQNKILTDIQGKIMDSMK